jgi:hypothetical protein
MNEPRRLLQSGGVAQRLLESASLDRPGPAARSHAASLAATASSFARTSSGSSGTYRAGGHSARSAHPAKTVVTWVVVVAAASVALGVLGSKLLAPGGSARAAATLASLPTLSAPAPAVRPPDISPEPATGPLAIAPEPAQRPTVSGPSRAQPAHIEPWVPSPLSVGSGAAPSAVASRPSPKAFDEARQIEAARLAISRGDCDAAIAHLDAYASSHPKGQLEPEAMALRIQALSIGGKPTEARALAQQFEAKYPTNPLALLVSRNVAK